MRRRTLIVGAMTLLMIATIALPAQAGHRKTTFTAHLTTGAELHEVFGSDAEGRFAIVPTRDGFAFKLGVRGLSGPSWGAHIHGAAADANGGILVGLCGAPAPAAVETCSTSDDGTLRVRGHISHALLAEWGITARELGTTMSDGLAYVNVHTDLNPAGEVRGQIGR